VERQSVEVEVERRVSQANRSQMARDLGLDRSYVSNVLSRRRVPSLDTAAGIAKMLGVSIDDLHGYLTAASASASVN
jgi:transcriptional regulator with XRE-family HTH domain